MFCKKNILGNLAKFTEKHSHQTGTSVFLWILRIFKNLFFFRANLNDCFWNLQKSTCDAGFSYQLFKTFFNRPYQASVIVHRGLRPATLLKKRLWCSVNFAKYLRTSFFIEHYRRLLLYYRALHFPDSKIISFFLMLSLSISLFNLISSNIFSWIFFKEKALLSSSLGTN